MLYVYARTSTKEQHIDRQITALLAAGVERKNIFIDKQSGKDFNRPKYKKLFRKLKSNDVVFISSVDRLGRDYEENTEQWRILTKEKHVDIVVLDMPLLDTRERYSGDLMGKMIADIALYFLSFEAQNYRTRLLERQAKGIVEAKKRGVRFGRPPIEKPADFEAVKSDYQAGEFSSRIAAELLNVSQSKFLDWIKEQ